MKIAPWEVSLHYIHTLMSAVWLALIALMAVCVLVLQLLPDKQPAECVLAGRDVCMLKNTNLLEIV